MGEIGDNGLFGQAMTRGTRAGQATRAAIGRQLFMGHTIDDDGG